MPPRRTASRAHRGGEKLEPPHTGEEEKTDGVHTRVEEKAKRGRTDRGGDGRQRTNREGDGRLRHQAKLGILQNKGRLRFQKKKGFVFSMSFCVSERVKAFFLL